MDKNNNLSLISILLCLISLLLCLTVLNSCEIDSVVYTEPSTQEIVVESEEVVIEKETITINLEELPLIGENKYTAETAEVEIELPDGNLEINGIFYETDNVMFDGYFTKLSNISLVGEVRGDIKLTNVNCKVDGDLNMNFYDLSLYGEKVSVTCDTLRNGIVYNNTDCAVTIYGNTNNMSVRTDGHSSTYFYNGEQNINTIESNYGKVEFNMCSSVFVGRHEGHLHFTECQGRNFVNSFISNNGCICFQGNNATLMIYNIEGGSFGVLCSDNGVAVVEKNSGEFSSVMTDEFNSNLLIDSSNLTEEHIKYVTINNERVNYIIKENKLYIGG